jgi:ANTAR domain-containing protein/GAF domain-containing protein
MSGHLHSLAVLSRLDEFGSGTARSRSSDRDLPALLSSLVDGAVDVVLGARAASILELSRRGVLSRHATHAGIEELDLLGAEHQEGPAVAAAGHASSVAATVTALDGVESERWPRWKRRADAEGVAATLTLTLPVTGGKRPTVLTFYSSRPDGFDQSSVEAAQAFAGPITVALQAVDQMQSLERAVESRDRIGQAKGVLMARHDLTADQAFSRLVQISQQTNVRLADVAAWLVDEVGSRDEPARPGVDGVTWSAAASGDRKVGVRAHPGSRCVPG